VGHIRSEGEPLSTDQDLKSSEKSLGGECVVGQGNGDRCVVASRGHSGL